MIRALHAISVLFIAALVFSLGGCGDDVSPLLSDFTFDGQAPDSSVVMLFGVSFDDPDGDLAKGSLETFINQSATNVGSLGMRQLFLDANLEDNATAGRLHFVLELSLTSDSLPESGSSFDVGIRASDAAGHTSSTEEMTIAVQY